jgi:DNA-binding transcriptional LysR family regulator
MMAYINPLDSSSPILLAQLEAFLAVAERRSVSGAAKALYLTQPALSARLRNLERELGTELFVRTPKGVRLTQAGHAFRPYAQRALQTLAEGRQLVAELSRGGAGQLTLGAAPALSTYALPPLLQRFQARYPNVQLIVRTGHSEEILEMVLREQVDLGLVREIRHGDVISVPIYEDEVVLVAHPQHSFAKRRTIRFGDLVAERLILFDRTSSYFELTSEFFRQGLVPPGLIELDNVEAAKKMVEHGLGAALLPRTSVAKELEAGTLVRVKIVGAPTLRRKIAAIRRRDSLAPSALADNFLAVVAEAGEELASIGRERR